MQKRIVIYGALAFVTIIAIGFKISHIKKGIKKIGQLSCEFDPTHQLSINDLVDQLNFGGCSAKWVAIHLTNQSMAITVRILK